jgi:Mn2+/Fe2+ NRAMP family transporter
MLMATNKRVMGDLTISIRPRILGWAATVIMIAAAIAMFAYWGN